MKRVILFFLIIATALLTSCNQTNVSSVEIQPESNSQTENEVVEANVNTEIDIELRILREPVQISSTLYEDPSPYIPGITILDNFGDIFLLRWDVNNQKFLPSFRKLFSTNQNLNSDEKILFSSLSAQNFIAVTNNYRVLTYGVNKYGQLGNNSFDDSLSEYQDITSYFSFLEGEEPIKVHMGNLRTGLLTNMGRIFIWGRTTFEVKQREFYSNVPVDVTNFFVFTNLNEKIVDFELAEEKLFITNFNTIYGWGSSGGGGLGIGGNNPINYSELYEALRMNLDETIKYRKLRAGDGGVLITSNNRVVVWGANYRSEISNSSNTIIRPYNLFETNGFHGSQINLKPDEFIISAFPGSNRYFFITNFGNVYLTGEGLVVPPGPNRFSIHSVENPLLLDISINDDSIIWEATLGRLIVFEDYKLKFIVNSDSTRESYERQFIELPEFVYRNKSESLDNFDVINFFDLEKENYYFVSEDRNESRIIYTYGKIR